MQQRALSGNLGWEHSAAARSFRGEPMPIRRFLGNDAVFDPDDLQVMGQAFSEALAKLGLYDRNDALVEEVARRIIRAALNGERNLIRLAEIGAGGRDPA
jgi:hypothetical protein